MANQTTKKNGHVKVRDLKTSRNPKGGGKIQVQGITITKTQNKASPP